MTNTRDKLNGAKYFLEELERVFSDVNQFRHELTAFLATIRSITLIMQEEFSGKPGFSAWYDQKQSEMKNSSILKYLHRLRNISLHERPVLQYPFGVAEQTTDGELTNIVLSGTGSNLVVNSHFMDSLKTRLTSRVKYYFSDIADKDKDVITICQEAVTIIERIVNECEDRFKES